MTPPARAFLLSYKNYLIPRNLFIVKAVRNLYTFSITLVMTTTAAAAATAAAMYSAVGSNIRKKNYYVPLQNIDETPSFTKRCAKSKNSPLYTFLN